VSTARAHLGRLDQWRVEIPQRRLDADRLGHVGDQSSDGRKIRGERARVEIASLCYGEGARRVPEPFFEVDRRVLGRAARRRVRGPAGAENGAPPPRPCPPRESQRWGRARRVPAKGRSADRVARRATAVVKGLSEIGSVSSTTGNSRSTDGGRDDQVRIGHVSV
jgi:hypothetical protein